MREVTLEFALMLKKEYDAGASLKALSKKYKTDCYYVFKKFNIQKKTKEEFAEWKKVNRRNISYNLKWDCQSITNEQEAYIIGLLMADGYVGKSQVGLRLKKSDKLLVKKVKDYFSEQITLQEDMASCYFVVSSIKICDNLKNLGVFSKKTVKELHIPPMSETLIRHFIRGYFDGDGSIFLCQKNNKNSKHTYLKSNICSPTKNILEEMHNFLKKVNIDSAINLEHRKGKKLKIFDKFVIGSVDMYRLFIRKKEAIEKWYHFLYDNNSICLERKFKVFKDNLELLKYIKKAC